MKEIRYHQAFASTSDELQYAEILSMSCLVDHDDNIQMDTDGVSILFTKLSVPEVRKLYLAHHSEHSHVANKVVVSIHRFSSVSL